MKFEKNIVNKCRQEPKLYHELINGKVRVKITHILRSKAEEEMFKEVINM